MKLRDISVCVVICALMTNFWGWPSDFQPAYVLGLSLPKEIAESSIKCLYHGEVLECKDGYIRLPETEFKTFFSIIVTPSVDVKCAGITPTIERISSMPCHWYNLTLRLDGVINKKKTYHWEVEKLDDSQMPLRLPENSALIMCLPPTFVDKLDDLEKESSFVVHLPKVVLKSGMNIDDIEAAMTEISLAFPEVNQYHSKSSCLVRKQPNIISTIVER